MTHRENARNFAGFCGFELFWGTAMPLTLLTTVMPAYISVIGGPLWLVAAVAQLPIVMAVLTGPAVLKWLAWRERRLGIMTGCQAAGALLYLALGGLALSPAATGAPLVAGSVAILLGIMVLSGLSSPLYYGLMMEVTPLHWRGRLVGVRGLILALTGLAGAALAERILSIGGVRGFGMSFIASVGFYLAGVTVLRLMVVERPIARKAHPAAQSFMALFRHLAGNRLFCRWLAAHLGIVAALSGVGLLAACYLERAGTAAAAAGFTLFYMLGRLVSSASAGWGADRTGCKAFAMAYAGCYAAACGVTLATNGAQWAPLAFALLGTGHGLAELWTANYLTELLPDENRVSLISASQLVASPAALATALAFGWLAGRHGFHLALAFPAAAALVSFGVIGFLLPEPRRVARPSVPHG